MLKRWNTHVWKLTLMKKTEGIELRGRFYELSEVCKEYELNQQTFCTWLRDNHMIEANSKRREME